MRTFKMRLNGGGVYVTHEGRRLVRVNAAGDYLDVTDRVPDGDKKKIASRILKELKGEARWA